MFHDALPRGLRQVRNIGGAARHGYGSGICLRDRGMITDGNGAKGRPGRRSDPFPRAIRIVVGRCRYFVVSARNGRRNCASVVEISRETWVYLVVRSGFTGAERPGT